AHLLPDLPLPRRRAGAPGVAVVDVARQESAQRAVRQGAAAGEPGRGVAPATRLDAADRDYQLAAGGHQDVRVQDAVLPGADEVLAGHQEDRLVTPVDGLQVRHAAALADLGDVQRAGRQGFVQGEVVGPAAGPPAQAEDLQAVG